MPPIRVFRPSRETSRYPSHVTICQALERIAGRAGRVVQITSAYGEKFRERGRGVTVETLRGLDEGLHSGRIAVETKDSRRYLHVHFGGWRFVLKLMPETGEIWVNTVHRAEPRHWSALTKRSQVEVVAE